MFPVMFRSAPEGDELQMNMDTISKELNALMVTEEKQQVANHPHVRPNGDIFPQTVMNTDARLEQALQYVTNVCYQQQGQMLGANPATHVMPKHNRGVIPKHNRNAFQHQGLQYRGGGYCAYENNSTYNSVHPGSGYSVDNSTPQRFYHRNTSVAFQCENNPKYELHYLRPQTDPGEDAPISLLSMTANDIFSGRSYSGSFRRQNRTHTRFNFRSELDYDEINVDLSTLGMSQYGKEPNHVLRLFACFRNLHNALAEIPPTFEPCIDSVYEPTFAPLQAVVMPCTMNVQYQVKYASRKLASFFSGLVQIVTNNRMYEPNLAEEFDRYLFKLQPLLDEFELYKRLELEHRRGQFVSEDIRVHAERLELLSEKLTQVLREVHLRVIAFDWYIGIKYHGKICRKMEPSINKIDGQPREHLKIGIVNEILQMCSIPPSTEIAQPVTTVAATATPDTQLATEAAAVGIVNADIVPMNIINNKNNDLFAAPPVTATRICGGLTKTTSNARQPASSSYSCEVQIQNRNQTKWQNSPALTFQEYGLSCKVMLDIGLYVVWRIKY